MIRCHYPDSFQTQIACYTRWEWDVWSCSWFAQPLSLPLVLLLHTWFVSHRAPLTHSSSVSSIFYSLTSSFTFLSFTHGPSIHYLLLPINTVPLLMFFSALCLFISSFSLSFSTCPSCLLFPTVSRSLPAMQTLKVNLHSKVLLLACATVTERFSSVPPLFSFLFSLISYYLHDFSSHVPIFVIHYHNKGSISMFFG